MSHKGDWDRTDDRKKYSENAGKIKYGERDKSGDTFKVTTNGEKKK